jgi:hypothetical protein
MLPPRRWRFSTLGVFLLPAAEKAAAGAFAAGANAFHGGTAALPKYSIRALKLGDRIFLIDGARGPGKGLRCARSSSSVPPSVWEEPWRFSKSVFRHIVGPSRRGSHIS